jgi:hypothetical protein
MKRTSIVIALALLAIGALPAGAQGLHLGPQVGFYKARGADDGEFLFGAAARVSLLPSLGIEGAIQYRQEEYGDEAVKVRTWPVTVSGLLYLLPFVHGTVGAGWYNTTFDYTSELEEMGAEDETIQEFGYHVGAGVELPWGKSTRLTGDIRYVFLDYDFSDVPGLGDTDSDFYVISVGVLFGF